MADLAKRFTALVEELGLCAAADVRAVVPLTGGVSSEIARVDLPGRSVCIKFALPQLKVAAEWHAPLERNLAEYRWLDFASGIVPGAVPNLYGYSERLNGFAMEFIDGEGVRNWKAELLEAPPRPADVQAVGRALVAIHAKSTAIDLVSLGFDNMEDFYALRLEPYLESLSGRHPELGAHFGDLIEQQRTARVGLVHGDVSPKNILFRGDTPVLLDAECATIGDPVFDVAFCINHFLLKAVHAPHYGANFRTAAKLFFGIYADGIEWEGRADFEQRLVRLLPALFLARVDGKSPVEYLSPDQQGHVRSLSLALLHDPPENLAALLAAMEGKLA